MFFYLCKVLFSDFAQFNGNFVDAQNNSEYRDWAPLSIKTATRRIIRLDELSFEFCLEHRTTRDSSSTPEAYYCLDPKYVLYPSLY